MKNKFLIIMILILSRNSWAVQSAGELAEGVCQKVVLNEGIRTIEPLIQEFKPDEVAVISEREKKAVKFKEYQKFKVSNIEMRSGYVRVFFKGSLGGYALCFIEFEAGKIKLKRVGNSP